MRGWVVVPLEATDDDDAIREWAEIGASYALSLPPK